MATIPPPLPSRRMPPPLPSRGGQVPQPSPRTGANPFATPDQFFYSTRDISTRDVARIHGTTYGVWVTTNSQYVMRMRYDPNRDANGDPQSTGTITIEYVSGSTWAYADRSVADWVDIFESSSKGRFAYYEIRGPGPSRKGMGIWPGIEIRPAWRTAKEIAHIRHARRPRTTQQKKRTYTRGGIRQGYGKGGLRVK